MDTLTHVEQRGWLWYNLDRPEYTITQTITRRRVPGWFMLSTTGHSVVMRKVGGRNRFLFVSVSEVVQFTADPTAK